MRNLRVLMYALHSDPRHFIGGGFIRAMQLLRHARAAGIEYHVVETSPRFKDVYDDLDYDGVALRISNPQTSGSSMARVVIAALRAGIKAIREQDLDLAYSPVEVHPSAFLPYLTHIMTGKPWTLMLNSIPLYGPTPEGTGKNFLGHGSSIAHMESYLRQVRRFGLVSASAGAAGYSLIYKMLERCSMPLAVSPVITTDLSHFDPKVKNVYVVSPGNGIEEPPAELRRPSVKALDGVVVASYAPEKGLLDSIRIWANVVKKVPKAVLGITGYLGRYGDRALARRSELDVLVDELGIRSNIAVLNDLQAGVSHGQLLSNLARGRVLLYPSTFDTWGLTVGEALSVDVPVVAYDTRALRYAFGECQFLRLVGVGDIKGFAETVVNVLSESNSEANLLPQRYLDKHSWGAVAQAERIAYSKCINLFRE
jgi:glycosyltransferase involved in cell wall biosynthesis